MAWLRFISEAWLRASIAESRAFITTSSSPAALPASSMAPAKRASEGAQAGPWKASAIASAAAPIAARPSQASNRGASHMAEIEPTAAKSSTSPQVPSSAPMPDLSWGV